MTPLDLQTVHAKLKRANEHATHFQTVTNEFFDDTDSYELTLEFDRQAQEIDVYGNFKKRPPLPYLGAVFGDFIGCYRAALDHLVWSLSVRHQPLPPPPHPIPHNNLWRYVGFPIVLDQGDWAGALGSRLRLVDPNLHDRFRDLQPFITNPAAPNREPLAKLDGLWNIDKHRVIHFPKLDIALEHLEVVRRADGWAIRFDLHSWGPRRVDLDAFDQQTQLARLRMREAWPRTADEVQSRRGLRVNVRLDFGPPGFGHNMAFLHDQINEAVVLAARAFEPEFT